MLPANASTPAAHLFTQSPCHPVTLSPCHLVTLSPCHPVTLSPLHRRGCLCSDYPNSTCPSRASHGWKPVTASCLSCRGPSATCCSVWVPCFTLFTSASRISRARARRNSSSVRSTLAFVVGFLPLNLIVGLAIALLMNQRVRGILTFRAIYYLPSVTSATRSCRSSASRTSAGWLTRTGSWSHSSSCPCGASAAA